MNSNKLKWKQWLLHKVVKVNELDPRDTEGQEKEQQKQARQSRLLREADDSLYALVFNNEAGQKLLKKWQEEYVHTWIARPEATQVGIGIKQGQANFVMYIINRLKQMEKGVENG